MKTSSTSKYNTHIRSRYRLKDLRHHWRKTLVLLMFAFASLTSSAALIQDEEGNYVIATKDDFIELMTKNTYWRNHHSFTQIADIDLEGQVLTPIGNTTTPFTGVYEGNGHTLKNAVMYWNNTSCYNYGIFGYICGPLTTGEYASVRNLNIENVNFTRQEDIALDDLTGNDVKIGVLAGQLCELVKIHDICIIDCQITDNDQPAKVKACMAGGLAGDLYKHKDDGTSPVTANELTIKNIYCQVDIKLDRIVNANNDQQFLVGGILGRMRYPTLLSQLPDNTVFTGTITAPRASISPTVANIRGTSANNFNTLVKTYAGELTSTLLKDAIGSQSAYNDFVRTRLFYDYQIYNSSAAGENKIEKITDTYPSVEPSGGKYAYGTRTLAPNANNNGTVFTSGWSNNSDSNWPRVQGINWADYTNPVTVETDRTRITDMLTNGREQEEVQTCHWEWDLGNNSCKLVNDNDLKFLKVYLENDVENNVYRVKYGYKDAFIPYPGTVEGDIQWYSATSIQNNDWTPIPGATGMTIPANKSLFFRVEVSYNGITITSDYIAPYRRIYVYNPESNARYNEDFADDVYKFNADNNPIYANAGRDINDGLTPETAVLTMAEAFKKLNEYGSVKTNTIVTMGYYTDDDYLFVPNPDVLLYNKPATITGTDNDKITNGILGLKKLNGSPKAGTKATAHFLYLQAPLRFDNIAIMSQWYKVGARKDNGGNSHATDGGFIVCNYFDLTIDENVRIVNFLPVSSTNGLAGNITSLPFISIIGGTQDMDLDATQFPIRYGNEKYPDHPGFYTTPNATTITVRSGAFGRIICCCRNEYVNGVSHNITGTPDIPNRIRLNVNIKNDIDFSDPNHQYSMYGDTLHWENNKLHYVSARYSHNIGLISGGQTDGSAYGDIIMNVYAGHISRIITSNITFGRDVDVKGKNNVVTAYYPSDSFWGRSILNIYGNTQTQADGTITSETTINEVFGGMLGRISSAPDNVVCRPYFYGKSVINMYGGYIGYYTGNRTDNGLSNLKTTVPNLYGVGSGGVTGLGYDEDHCTTDKAIPFINNQGKVSYGVFSQAKGNMPKMTMLDGEEIDLEIAKCEVNIYSGMILGSVYGGGYGYSSSLEKYSGVWVYQKAPGDLGVLYGDSKVTMYRHPDFQPPVVLGNIYGSGRGSSFYAEHFHEAAPNETENRFLGVAAQYGNTQVIISDGTIGNPKADPNDPSQNMGGNVYAGSQGVKGYQNIAALYGSTNLIIEGGTIYGNIYGGSEIANIHKHSSIENSGNTHVTINDGTIGNNIFGGSKGIDKDQMEGETEDSKALIAGSTNVTINGGDFIDWPYIDLRAYIDPSQETPVQLNPKLNIVDNRDKYRTFNIYGGGYMNCDIKGNANLKVYSSLLRYDRSFVDAAQNPNAIPDPTIVDETTFHKHYMDITYRNFCVYGGGFGEKTNVLNTDVYITIPSYRQHVTKPHGYTLQSFLDHQSFFDVCGGGYSGDVGHWVTGQYAKDKYGIEIDTPVNNIKNYNKTTDVFADFKQKVKDSNPGHDFTDDELQTEIVKLYDHYKEGNCKVVIDDYTFTRKVIGGGFYGSCRTTDTHVRCGSLRQVYGGSLLGYVHDRAFLQFGNRIEDFARWNPNQDDGNGGKGAYVYSETEEFEPFKGDFENLRINYPDVFAQASAFAKELNDNIYITENIYGGNDVKGIIGTQFWEAPKLNETDEPVYGVDPTDGGPLFCTNVDITEEKGIVFNIYGGTFMGNVYGAGNGHYRGYFVPEWVRYSDGPARMYRSVISSVHTDKDGNPVLGKAYRSRPMVGCVNVNLRGNSDIDYIKLHGNFFGGGRECTIGQFNTILPLEDPRRLVAGGQLHVNIGGFIQIDGNVYLGAEGKLYSEQQCLPEEIDLKTFDGSTTEQLARLGEAAYDHWYYDLEEGCYLPGYPAPGKVDGNFGMYGEHMLASYMQNVQLQGDVELTFYRFLYERDQKGCFTYRTFSDGSENRIRRHWIPGEIALDKYDAPSVVMNSFFLGGLSGSMTNNNVMKYIYPKTDEYPGEEKWGCIYRVVLPEGVTVRDKVVMGSENATIDIYPYNEKYTGVIKEYDIAGQPSNRLYSYEGGMITQPTFSFDLIAYNDKYDEARHAVPTDFYSNPDKYDNISSKDDYQLKDGSGTIYRYNYATQTISGNNTVIPYLNNKVKDDPRYSLTRCDWFDKTTSTYVEDANGERVKTAYLGPRDFRTPSDKVDAENNELAVVTKLTLACKFEQLVGESAPDPDDHHYHYGGNVYGGCYNSGIVIGDVVMNIGSNLLGTHLNEAMSETFNDYSSLKYNIGRVFGGGYGENTRIEGNTYVNLLHDVRAMNVFGGGMMGDVLGHTHIKYIGHEENSYIFGGIYGGGLMGSVGVPFELNTNATSVRLFSGNVERVFGGSCMGTLYGRAYVELCDQVTSELEYLDYKRLHYDEWSSSRLIAGKVFGGNDIAGHIAIAQPRDGSSGNDPNDPNDPGSTGNDPNDPGSSTTPTNPQDEIEKLFEGFSTCVYIHEEPNIKKDSPGSIGGYNGFPLVGDLYGGSNGNYGVHGKDGVYIDGEVELASGDGIGINTINLKEPKEDDGLPYNIPHIDKSHLLIHGGSVINAYGGGDKCNITQEDKITVEYKTDGGSREARAGFDTQDELNRVWAVLHFSSDQQQSEVIKHDDQGCPVFKYQICRLFGGNNNADMDIQPTWSLKSGFIGSLYSGGNFGKMTFYQPAKAAVPAQGEEGDPDYIPAEDAVKECGLSLTINSYDLEINNVYGGGRLGDIDPNTTRYGVTYKPSKGFYGATLNIEKGIINHVYGGNDVSGYVMYGTNVNLRGAISGDVYCAGNGNYLYQYDRDGIIFGDEDGLYDSYFVQDEQDHTLYNLDTSSLRIREQFSFETDQYNGARYFQLPARTDFGLERGVKYNASDALTIMAINSYRPHVQRTKLYIEGQEDNKVWVRGNVYCGGNSASVFGDPDAEDYDVEFNIGSHVILNGVFLGSNGYSLAMGDMIMNTERLNADKDGRALNMVGVNDLEWAATTTSETQTRHIKNLIDKAAVDDKDTLYPTVLDLYMRAVETTETPRAFDPTNPDAYIFDPNIFDSYIGEFCVGGNRGSMMTSKCIDLTFPSSITIFGRIIGGCKDADVTYNGVTHIGGLNKPLDEGLTTKVDLKVKSKFRPLNLMFPDVNSTPPISIHNVIVDHDGNPWSGTGDKYYLNQQCNVYGGCFTSGTTVGDIKLDIFSDMLNYDAPSEVDIDPDDSTKGVMDNPEYIDKQAVINGVQDTRSWRAFTVVGGGYGAKTAVYGNINVRMLPEAIGSGLDRKVTHPSVATIFGGSQEGLIVGNTNVEIRDGKILANVYGASEAAKMYGSTSVIVGYPKYYRTLKTGNYHLKRVDLLSETSRNDFKDEFDEVVVPKTVAYFKNDLVPENVYRMIDGRVKNNRIKTVLSESDPNFRVGKNVESKYVDKITFDLNEADAEAVDDLSTSTKDDTPVTYYMGYLFAPVESSIKDAVTNKPIADHIIPDDFGVSWDDITIWIGDQSSNLNPTSGVYYGQGNLYGGGYVPNTTDRTLVGRPTVMRFTPKYNMGYVSEFDAETDQTLKENLKQKTVSLYGGNTAVMIWDDPRCAEINPLTGDYKYTDGSPEIDPLTGDLKDTPDQISDHVHIGAGYFKKVDKQLGESAKGFFEKVEKTVTVGSDTKTEEAYIYITSGKVEKDSNGKVKTYYEKIADGGVYGGGRKMFAEGFRSIDLAYYGYADHSPQKPKLLNTIQRADVATVTDCCMELVGASDFTVNDYKGIYYAINRVGELRMYTSLRPDKPLDTGYTDDTDGISIHSKKRSRNYIALYTKTNHLGALLSDWAFDEKYHDEHGVISTKYDSTYGYPTTGPNASKESYVNHKHRYIDFYKDYAALKWEAEQAEANNTAVTFTKEEVDAIVTKYNDFNGFTGSDQFSYDIAGNTLTDYLKAIGDKMRETFVKRNVGTSGNMIGISSGYELSFEGLACQRGETKETKYYGPVYGVTEMKLLTTVSGMGGGYVYALNHHFEDTTTEDPYFKFDGQDFLQTTGNFVFPGASYHNTSKNEDRHNFLVDDCYDFKDMDHGYYECPNGYVGATGHNRDVLQAPAKNTFNVNEPHEIHYWYVSGDTYTFNVTLTAFTSDDPVREFTLSNENDRVNLFNVKPGTKITVEEVNWFVHSAEDLSNGFSCDITHKDHTGEGENRKDYFDKKYKLYLTLSDDPQNTLTDNSNNTERNGAYVIRLPRYTYLGMEDNESHKIVNSLVGNNVDDNYEVVADSEGNKFIDPNYYLNDKDEYNDFFGLDAEGNKITTIKPRLGLRLVDEQPNRLSDKSKEESQAYFDKHLKPVHPIQVKLKTQSPNAQGKLGEPIYFIINIDLKYLMGPAVYGNIQIENCALPGEYIFVNADGIEVVMDPELGVAEQSWRLYPNDEEGNPYDDEHYTIEDADHSFTPDSKGYLYCDMNTPEFVDGEYEETTVNNVTTTEFVITNEKLLHIPAYYYQNGWNPVFTVKANGEDFQCSLPFYDKKTVTVPDPDNEGQTITVEEDDKTKPHPENRLQIHNYHRMKPLYKGNVTDNVKNLLFNEISYDDGGDPIYDADGNPTILSKVIDLRLIPGARIYLESQDDMRYFFEYMFQMQNPTIPAGFKRYKITYKSDPSETDPTKWNTTTTNPMYCEGLNFYQQKNLLVPAKEYHHGDDPHIFKGLYHGNGNYMEIPSGAHINMINKGYLFNTGFVSHVANDNTIIYNDNKDGYIVNSFYFNHDEKGVLAKNGKLANCYQNTDPIKHKDDKGQIVDADAVEFRYNQLMKISSNGFRYGQVAYNLNGFYLQKRHQLLHEPYGTEPKPENNPYALNQRDIDLRGDASLSNEKYLETYAVKYIEDMFNNGDYRYALYYKPLENDDYLYKQFTEALRTADEPNYFDFKDNRNKDKVSMHNYEHTVDQARWCDTHQLYHPIFDKDYLFFGEDLSVDLEEAHENNHLPVAYHPENRVYRVGGFYGSAADKGYYMNRNAYLDTPLMTAIDFVGYRDRDMYDASGALKGAGTYNGTVDDYSVKVDPATYDYKGHLKYDGWIICKGWHEIFMAPTLDLPWTLDASNNPIHDFYNFEVNSNKVTHNLLIYTEDIKEANDVMAKFHYTPTFTYGQTDEYSFATHPDGDIKAHHIVDDGTGPVMSEGYFHLVDKHDFNAPVAFKAKTAWYNRKPQEYCYEFSRTNGNGDQELYKGAWEGICLPFDVGQVYAASTDYNIMRDMGEITHFFGDEWNSHEYWLRRLATSSPVSGQLCFERPTAANLGVDKDNNPNPEKTGDYIYKNTAIYDLYKDLNYDESNVKSKVDGKDYTHDLLYHFDDNSPTQSRTIKDYRYLSRSIPYIVTYPGKDFYEFDLSGEFYAKQLKKYGISDREPVPQTICYLAMKDADDPDHVTIHVTDEVSLISYTQEGFTMKGTFMHVTDNDDLSESVLYQKVENLAVLDGVKVIEDANGNPIEGNEVHNSYEFVQHSDDMVVLPFRTYLVGTSSSKSKSIIPIGSRSIIHDEEIVEEPDPELPEAIDAEQEGIKVWVEGQKLVIKTPYDLTTTIYDMAGRPIRHIKAYEGTNRYSGLDQGFYIVLRTKFAIL